MHSACMDMEKPLRTAVALEHGIGRWELGHGPWDHPHRGVVQLAGHDEADAQNRIDGAIPLLTSGAVLGGWASAFHQGVRMLDGIDLAGRPHPITIVCPESGQLRPRHGIAPSRRRIHRNEIVVFEGVPMTTLARTAFDLALDAPNLCEAMVAIDMCVSTVIRQSRTTMANIVDLFDRHKKTRGIVQARRALSLASTRSAGPWETRTRHEAEIGAGIERLLVNAPIFDLEGNLAGVADLLHEASGLVIESDGAGHRDEIPHAEDNVREEKLERLGLVVSRVTAVDHRNRHALRGRLGEARLHATLLRRERNWTLEKPDWWWRWKPGRRWD